MCYEFDVTLHNAEVFVSAPVGLDPNLLAALLVVSPEATDLVKPLARLEYRPSCLGWIGCINFELYYCVLEARKLTTLARLVWNETVRHWFDTSGLVAKHSR